MSIHVQFTKKKKFWRAGNKGSFKKKPLYFQKCLTFYTMAVGKMCILIYGLSYNKMTTKNIGASTN